MYTQEQLEGSTLTELRRIARELAVERRTVLGRDDLINAILAAQAVQIVDDQQAGDDAAQDPDQPEADSVQRPRDNRVALALMALGALLLVVCGILGIFLLSPDKEVAQKPKDQQAEIEQVANVHDQRDPRFVQQDIGTGELNRVVGEGLNGNTAQEYTNNLLEIAGHSAHALAIYANGAGLWDDPNKVDPLLVKDKSYLSDEGIRLWHSLRGALTAQGTSVVVGEAPPHGINSGVSGGTYGQASRSGISGNRKAVIYTFKDGSKLYILIRCGNIVYQVVQDLPVVPTDEDCKTGPYHVPSNPAYQPEWENDPNLVVPTPGYERDRAEDAYKPDQTGTDKDATGEAPSGSHGGGSTGTSNPTTTPIDPSPDPDDDEVSDGVISSPPPPPPPPSSSGSTTP